MMREAYEKMSEKDDFDEMWNRMNTITQMEDQLLSKITGYSMSADYKILSSGIHKLSEIKNTPLMIMKS